MEKKYIHYCWFGGKPLSDLTKKCIDSWQKYLPDFEIMRWDESNCDINECPFVKEAYSTKNWAFVADYFRSKVMKEYGGIYFDTDIEVVKDISSLLREPAFLGVEDSGYVAVGVWWESKPDSKLASSLLDFYHLQGGFDVEKVHTYSIPKLVTNILLECGFDSNKIDLVQRLDDKMVIYPRDYFYPLSYDHQSNVFDDNTCMIHYYDASWVPKWEQKEIKLIRKYGKDKAQNILKRNLKVRSIIKILLYPAVLIRRKINNKKSIENYIKVFDDEISRIEPNSPLVFYNPEWFGTTQATINIFDNAISLRNINSKTYLDACIQRILEKKPSLVVFSAFSLNWSCLVENLHKNSILTKVIWHGSNAMNIEDYDYKAFTEVLNFLDSNIIDSIGFVKKSMYELYKAKGYKVEFIKNTVHLDKNRLDNNKLVNNNNVKIGIYASGDRWVKNFFNQLSGASLIENAIIDIVPLASKVEHFAKILKCNVVGSHINISHDELLKRMAANDVNIYATFVECAPIIPLESLELGVPCLTGNNHHYWEGTELEKYLVVNKVDNPVAISEQIEFVLKNRDYILELYKQWKRKYDIESQKSVQEFLNIQ